MTFSWYPALSRRDLGTGPTGAWWVRRPTARAADEGTLARIDAHSHALREVAVTSTISRQPVSRPGGSGESQGSGTVLGEPGDLLGDLLPEQLNTLDPSTGLRVTRSWAAGEAVPRRRSVELDLRNVRSLRLPTRDAGRRARERLRVTVTTDGPVALGLRQLVPRRVVKLDGKRAGRAGRRGGLTLRIGAGQHTIAL